MMLLPSTVTAVADGLEQRGFVQRLRDPADRRAWLLELTHAGHAIQSQNTAMAVEFFHRITGLSPDEINTFHHLMQKIRSHNADVGPLQDSETCSKLP